MLLAFKPLLHKAFLWKERNVNSIIAVIAFLVIASLVAPYSHSYHSASPHPEWNTPCGADLSLPLFGIFKSIVKRLQHQPSWQSIPRKTVSILDEASIRTKAIWSTRPPSAAVTRGRRARSRDCRSFSVNVSEVTYWRAFIWRLAGRCHMGARNTLIIRHHLIYVWIHRLFLASNPHVFL